MLILTERLSPGTEVSPEPPRLSLALSAEERTRSRYRYQTDDGEVLLLQLPRGTHLQDGDLLSSPTGEIVKITAKPEPVLTVTAHTPLDLLRAAYHLGNRHIPLEIAPNYLRLSPDPVLEKMLVGLGVAVKREILPFDPETGAYGHNH